MCLPSLADVGAAFLLVHQGPTPASRFILITIAGIALYWAGMILNDVFDVEQDREQRPETSHSSRSDSAGASKNGRLAIAVGRNWFSPPLQDESRQMTRH